MATVAGLRPAVEPLARLGLGVRSANDIDGRQLVQQAAQVFEDQSVVFDDQRP